MARAARLGRGLELFCADNWTANKETRAINETEQQERVDNNVSPEPETKWKGVVLLI